MARISRMLEGAGIYRGSPSWVRQTVKFFHQPLYHITTRAHSSVTKKRVLGAIAHINSGKTTTSEAMLYAAGALRRMGNVDVGDTMLDYLPAERERGITINAAAVSFDWRDHTFFLVDSPGHLDFTYEVERALKVMDGVIVLLDAVAGVQPQTETVWRQADRNGLPRVVFVNKMDRDGADFGMVVDTVRKSFGAVPLVTQTPVFRDGRFCGVFDLLQRFDEGSNAGLLIRDEWGDLLFGGYQDLSSEQKIAVDNAVEELTETVADVNDEVMEKWVNGEQVPHSLIQNAIRTACINGKLVPILCGSSLKNIGVEPLMDSVIRFLPSPTERNPVKAVAVGGGKVTLPATETSPLLAYAFKVTHDKHRGRMVHLRAFSGELTDLKKSFLNTTKGKIESPTRLLRVLADKYVDINSVATGDIFAAVGLKHTETGDTIVLKHASKNSHVIMDGVKAPPAVFSVALSVDSTTQEKVLMEALNRAIEEDCSLELRSDDETGETLLSGMGELHLEVTIDRLQRALPFEIAASKPRVAYRETIYERGELLENYDVTIGNSHLKASLLVSIKPGEGCHITTDGFGSESECAIRDGVDAALGRGALLGASVTDVSVHVKAQQDGDTNTDAAALRACAGKAVRKLLDRCGPVLLEPVMSVEVTVPDANAGDIVSELSHPTKRRGMIESVDSLGHGLTRVCAHVPMEGIIGWATRMRSLTKGRGDLIVEFDGYRRVEDTVRRRVVEGI